MLLLFCVISLVATVASEGCHFGYTGEHGVDHWGEDSEQCKGKHQSPINIDSHNVTFVKQSPFETTGFDVKTPSSLTNNGHTAMMTLDQPTIMPTICGGPLAAVYEFAQLHFHWGGNDTSGGENEINNKTNPMEIHLVFYKKEYSNFSSALAHADGLTVLGCLFEIVKEDNIHYAELVNTLKKITQPNGVAKIDYPPALYQLMPKRISSYFTYMGSLTTPPCTESVIWVDFDHTVKISHAQMQAFRGLTDGEGEPLVNNFRAVQPLGDREVFYCKDEL